MRAKWVECSEWKLKFGEKFEFFKKTIWNRIFRSIFLLLIHILQLKFFPRARAIRIHWWSYFMCFGCVLIIVFKSMLCGSPILICSNFRKKLDRFKTAGLWMTKWKGSLWWTIFIEYYFVNVGTSMVHCMCLCIVGFCSDYYFSVALVR